MGGWGARPPTCMTTDPVRALRGHTSPEVVPPARFVQHPHEPAPAVNYWYPPRSRSHVVVTAACAVLPSDREHGAGRPRGRVDLEVWVRRGCTLIVAVVAAVVRRHAFAGNGRTDQARPPVPPDAHGDVVGVPGVHRRLAGRQISPPPRGWPGSRSWSLAGPRSPCSPSNSSPTNPLSQQHTETQPITAETEPVAPRSSTTARPPARTGR